MTNMGENPITHSEHEHNIIQIRNIITWDLQYSPKYFHVHMNE